MQESVVLLWCADGDTQTIVTELYVTSVAHDDTLRKEVVVDGLGARNAEEDEIGVRREDELSGGEASQSRYESGALLLDEGYPLAYAVEIGKQTVGFALGQYVDVIGILDLVE